MFIYFLTKTIPSANSILDQNKNNCVIYSLRITMTIENSMHEA